MISPVRSLVYTLLACLALAVALFPKVRTDAGPPVDPFKYTLNLARERYATQGELLRRAHSRMLAAAAIAQTAKSAEPVATVRDAGVPDALLDRVALALGRSLKPARHDPGMRVVVAVTIDTGGVVAGEKVLRSYRSLHSDAFVPGSIDPGVCSIVARATDPQLLQPLKAIPRLSSAYQQDFGTPCGWYAAYGAPGRGIATWLDSTHFFPIKSRSGRISSGYYMPQAAMMAGVIPFANTRIGACRAEREHACEALVLRPEFRILGEWGRSYPATPGWIGQDPWMYSEDAGFSSLMLTGLEHDLGAEGFAAFWKSNEALPVAFAAARGESLDSWSRMRFWGGRGYHAGPLPDRPTSIALLIALPGLLGLGVLGIAKRGSFA